MSIIEERKADTGSRSRRARNILGLRRLPAARVAVGASFFISGAGFASWAVRIPDVQARLALTASDLGLALLGVAAGALVAMPLSGGLMARYGSRPVARAAALIFAMAIALPPHAPGRALLMLSLVVLGGAKGVLGVAMNTQAAAVERHLRRPVMASLHAMYSVGGLAGAAVGGGVAEFGAAPGWHLALAAIVIAAVTLAINPVLLRPGLDGAAGSPAFARPTRPLLLLGAVTFCVLFGEGAAADWSAVYLRDVAGAGPGLAAGGFAAFSLMMASGRFAGDRLLVRLGPARLVRIGGLTAAAGIGLALAVAAPWTAIVGLGAVGAGLSTIFPTVLAAAGRLSDTAAPVAIAAISTIGYTGFLAGPPLIGFAAEAISLRGAFGLVGLTSLLVAALAGALPHAAALAPRGRTSSARALPSPRLREVQKKAAV